MVEEVGGPHGVKSGDENDGNDVNASPLVRTGCGVHKTRKMACRYAA